MPNYCYLNADFFDCYVVVCLLLLGLKFVTHAILIFDVEQQVKLRRVVSQLATILCYCCDVVEQPDNQLVEWCVLEKLTAPPVAIAII